MNFATQGSFRKNRGGRPLAALYDLDIVFFCFLTSHVFAEVVARFGLLVIYKEVMSSGGRKTDGRS
jgi:hypothetical protein